MFDMSSRAILYTIILIIFTIILYVLSCYVSFLEITIHNRHKPFHINRLKSLIPIYNLALAVKIVERDSQ
jgi:hypothetical protein